MLELRTAEVLVDGLDHPEGVAYDHRRARLYAGGEDGQVYAVDVENRTFAEIARTPGFVLGLAVDGVGRIVVCDSQDGAIWVIAGDTRRRLVARAGDRTLILPNYPAFGPDGTLYVSDSGRWKEHNGATIAIPPVGPPMVFDARLSRFPNGCAVTADGRELWVIQSLGPDVSRFDLRHRGAPETVVRLPGTVPDGLAFTEDGGAIISCYRPDRIYYLSPSGELDILAEDPEGTLLAAPTNICFVGPSRSHLVTANLGRRHLTLLETHMVGVVPHAPDRWAVDAAGDDEIR